MLQQVFVSVLPLTGFTNLQIRVATMGVNVGAHVSRTAPLRRARPNSVSCQDFSSPAAEREYQVCSSDATLRPKPVYLKSTWSLKGRF